MSIQSDVEYVKSIAESGRSAPLLSGRFSIIWGGLAVVALIVHWAVLAGVLDWPEPALGGLWAAYGITGTILSFIAASLMRQKPGGASAGNVASRTAWTTATIVIFLYAIAMTIRVVYQGINGGDPDTQYYDTILPLAFAGYSQSFAITARLSGIAWIKQLAYVSLAAVFISTLLIGRPELYLFAALVVLLVAVIPGVIMLRAEPPASR